MNGEKGTDSEPELNQVVQYERRQIIEYMALPAKFKGKTIAIMFVLSLTNEQIVEWPIYGISVLVEPWNEILDKMKEKRNSTPSLHKQADKRGRAVLSDGTLLRLPKNLLRVLSRG